MKKTIGKKVLASLLAAAGLAMWQQPCVWAEEAKTDAAGKTGQEQDEDKDKTLALTEEETIILQGKGYKALAVLSNEDAGIMPLASNSYNAGEGSTAATAGTAVGGNAYANMSAVAIGYNSNTQAGAVAVGSGAYGWQDGVAIGMSATANMFSIAIGRATEAAESSIVIGSGAKSATESVVIGNKEISAVKSTVVGMSAMASGGNSTAIGYSAKAVASGVAVGSSSNAVENATAFGYNANAGGEGSTAFGNNAFAKNNGIAVGRNASAEVLAIAIGYNAEASEQGVALGMLAMVEGSNSVAIGNGSKVTENNTVSFGNASSSLYRDLEGIENITLNGKINGVNITTLNSDVKTLNSTVQSKADKATTLEGYGIQDAYTKSAVDSALSQKASQSDVTDLTGRVGTAETGITTLKTNTAGITAENGTTRLANGFKVGAANYGMTTAGVLTAQNGSIGSVNFNGGVVSGVSSINGISVNSNNKSIGGVVLDGGKVNGITVGSSGISGFTSGNIANGDGNAVTAKAVKDYIAQNVSGDVSNLAGRVGTLETRTTNISYSSGTTTISGSVDIAASTQITGSGVTVGTAKMGTSSFAVGDSKLESGSLTVDANNTWTADGGLKIGATTLTKDNLTVAGAKIDSSGVAVGNAKMSTNSFAVGDSKLESGSLTVDANNTWTVDGGLKIGATTLTKDNFTVASASIGGVNVANNEISGVNQINELAVRGKTIAGVTFEDAEINFAGKNIVAAGTVNGITVGASGISGFTSGNIENGDKKAVTAEAVKDYVDGKLGGSGNDLTSRVDKLETNTTGITYSNGITTIAGNTQINNTGITVGGTGSTTKITNESITTKTVYADKVYVQGDVFTGDSSDGHFALGESGSIINNIYDKDGNNSTITHFQTNISNSGVGDVDNWDSNTGIGMAVFDSDKLNSSGGGTDKKDLVFADSTTGSYMGVQQSGIASIAKQDWNKDTQSGKVLQMTQNAEGQILSVVDTTDGSGNITRAKTTAEGFSISGAAEIGSSARAFTEIEYFKVDTTNGKTTFTNAAGGQTVIDGDSLTTGRLTSSAGTIGNVTFSGGKVNGVKLQNKDGSIIVGGIDITEMRGDVDNLLNNGGGSGEVTTANTVGIKHEGVVNKDSSTTIIEGNTSINKDGIKVQGKVDANELKINGQSTDDRYAAKDDVYTKKETYTKLQVDDKFTGVNEALKLKADKTAVDTLQTGLSEVTAKTANISYTGGETKIGGISFGVRDTISGVQNIALSSINGITISNADSGSTLKIGDVDLSKIKNYDTEFIQLNNSYKSLKEAIEGLDGGTVIVGKLENTDGISRDAAEGAPTGEGTTIIELNTSIDKNGLKTGNLSAANAEIGNVKFLNNGIITNVTSINGATISGSNFNGIDVSAMRSDLDELTERVKNIDQNGTTGGSGSGGGNNKNTAGIERENSTTIIETNTKINSDGIKTNNVTAGSVVVGEGTNSKTVINEDGITVAGGSKNQVQINDEGIQLGTDGNTSISAEDGFKTDKGLYVGGKDNYFKVDSNGSFSSKNGSYSFSSGRDGVTFSKDNSYTYGSGTYTDTTIDGNVVQTGRVQTDELWVDGNKIKFDGVNVGKQDFINNHLESTQEDIDRDKYGYTNDFSTSLENGTTQQHIKTEYDDDGNATSSTGTKVNTSFDGMTVSKVENEIKADGTLGSGQTVTDETVMTGGEVSVNNYHTAKDKDGKDTGKTYTNSVTQSEGDIHLKKYDEEGNLVHDMNVGESITNLQDGMQEMGRSINKLGKEVDEVGALSAALAGLHPNPENANSRADLAMAMGSYDGEQAIAVGGFYRADKRTMFSVGASATSSKQMFNMGVSIALDRMPEAERRDLELKKAVANNEAMEAILERLNKLEADNKAMRADNEAMRYENDKMKLRYSKLSADYEELKEKYGIKEVKAAELLAQAKEETAAAEENGTEAESGKQQEQQPVKRIVVIEEDAAEK